MTTIDYGLMSRAGYRESHGWPHRATADHYSGSKRSGWRRPTVTGRGHVLAGPVLLFFDGWTPGGSTRLGRPGGRPAGSNSG